MHNPMSGKVQADFESWILDPENQEQKTEVLKDQWMQMEQLCLDMPLSSNGNKIIKKEKGIVYALVVGGVLCRRFCPVVGYRGLPAIPYL